MLSLPPILTRFVEQTPVPVMARALIERVVGAQALDAWFEEQRAGQYTRELLFSTLFGLMTQVVLRESPSVHAAYRARIGEIGVSVTSVYTTNSMACRENSGPDWCGGWPRKGTG